ncbi:D-arabinono-1,4-lactone oxidase-like protein [Medicago truncatula]|nr:D-arabinono-1,4-lactone oxidase-like protein [Medicago truncatula]
MRKLEFKSTIFIFLFIIYGVISTPPADPIQCSSNNTNCTITNSNGVFPDRSICRASEVMYPTTEAELISIVALASKNNRKVKVATRFSHSIPKLACPDDNGLLISTKNLNRVLKVDVKLLRMTVESGVTLREIISEAARFEMALPNTPYWWGLTIGGLISTGAHGSTLWGKGSAVHEYVTHIRIVSPAGCEDGYAKVRNLNESHQDLNAARVSLGVLGVISQVTLQLEPLFKRSLTYLTKNDSDLGDELITFGKKHEFADVTWYPSQQKVLYRIDDRVSSVNTFGNGLYDSIGLRSTPSSTLTLSRTTEELQEATHDTNGKCINGKLTTETLAGIAYGLSNNNGTFIGYPVVGFNNRIQSSGTCLDSLDDQMSTACIWDSRIKGPFNYDTAFSIPLSIVKYFIEDVKKLVQLEPKALCGLDLYNGILMRYVTTSSAYLGKTEDAVEFDIIYYRSKDPLTPRLYEDIIEEIEQIGLFKYGGLPHWGKNRNIGFVGAIKKYNKANRFLKVKKKYDPKRLFSSDWTDQVLGLKEGVTILKDGCALEGLCICSKDSHCSPKKNYFCRPGRIYKDARVCRLHVKT